MSLSLHKRGYVLAARYMGVPGRKIVLRHMLPNIGSLLVINFTLGVVVAVKIETGLLCAASRSTPRRVAPSLSSRFSQEPKSKIW